MYAYFSDKTRPKNTIMDQGVLANEHDDEDFDDDEDNETVDDTLTTLTSDEEQEYQIRSPMRRKIATIIGKSDLSDNKDNVIPSLLYNSNEIQTNVIPNFSLAGLVPLSSVIETANKQPSTKPSPFEKSNGIVLKPQQSNVNEADIFRVSPRKTNLMAEAGISKLKENGGIKSQKKDRLTPDNDMLSSGSGEESEVKRKIDFQDENDEWNESTLDADRIENTVTALSMNPNDDNQLFKLPSGKRNYGLMYKIIIML